MNKKKALLIIVLIVVGIIGYLGYSYYNKSHRDIEKEKASIVVSSSLLFRDFEEDETTANNKYLNKVIIINGKIGEITFGNEENNMETTIIIRGEDDFFGVICGMLPSFNDEAAKLNRGDEIKIKGICDGFIDDVVLRNCSIIK